VPVSTEEYAAFVASRAKTLKTPTEDLLHAAIGLAGEGGEALDAIKKVWVYNKPLDKQNLIEEFGDALFYIVHGLNVLGITLDQAMEFNVAKLQKCYPLGYSDADAQARADKIP
jgi:NTP pyrophosphatase (non-canonical NTP hydrolase)